MSEFAAGVDLDDDGLVNNPSATRNAMIVQKNAPGNPLITRSLNR
jgi:hypothetical protein